MDYEIVTLPERIAAGVAARTKNSDPNMQGVIGALWGRFFGGGVYDSIMHKTDEKALGIYTEYEGDENAEFTVLAACAVSEAPENGTLSVCKIPAGRYAKFVARGNMHTAVADAWRSIWQTPLPRSFVCDFEEYQNGDMENAEIHIYIGLKEDV